MADKQDTAQDFNPKHRVVGAIILVGLAVILLPLILRDRAAPEPTAPVADVPAPETRVVITPITPVPLPDHRPEAAAVKTIPSLVTPPAQTAPSKTATNTPTAAADGEQPSDMAEDHPPAIAAPSTKSTTKPSAPPAVSATKGWIVQLGVFSRADNAKRLKQDLARHAYTPELDKITLDKGQGVRVRVGPYASESEARAVQARIQHELNIKGVVRAYP